jgi:type IV secretory pathway VirB10-like protein
MGFALLTSAFSAGIALSQNTNQYSTTGIPTNSQVVTQALGQQLGELGITITQKNLNIQPTIMVRVGYRFNVRVDRDIAFEAPYAPY